MNNKTNPIAFLDSGLGGLSVYSEFTRKLPFENTIYFADLKHLPYGNKSEKELINISRKIFDFLKEQNIKALVIACNTLSAVVYDVLKSEYDFKIYPILQIFSKIISYKGYNKIGIFATKATVNSGAYRNNLKKFNKNISVLELVCSDWVDFIEFNKLNTKKAKDDFREKMETMLKFQPEKIILGCTHYPIIINYFIRTEEAKKYFLNPSKEFINYIISDLKASNYINENNIKACNKFYATDNFNNFSKNAKLFYEIEENPILLNL